MSREALVIRFYIPTAYFLEQVKGECYFYNGTQQVRFIVKAVFNHEEYARFDSDVGEFRAVTELGRQSAAYWNQQKEFLERARAAVDRCRYNYEVLETFAVPRRGERTCVLRRCCEVCCVGRTRTRV